MPNPDSITIPKQVNAEELVPNSTYFECIPLLPMAPKPQMNRSRSRPNSSTCRLSTSPITESRNSSLQAFSSLQKISSPHQSSDDSTRSSLSVRVGRTGEHRARSREYTRSGRGPGGSGSRRRRRDDACGRGGAGRSGRVGDVEDCCWGV